MNDRPVRVGVTPPLGSEPLQSSFDFKLFVNVHFVMNIPTFVPSVLLMIFLLWRSNAILGFLATGAIEFYSIRVRSDVL